MPEERRKPRHHWRIEEMPGGTFNWSCACGQYARGLMSRRAACASERQHRHPPARRVERAYPAWL